MLERTSKVEKIIFSKQISIHPMIILWVGTKKIWIGDGRLTLTEPEIDWLAQELSDYLGIPITKSVEREI